VTWTTRRVALDGTPTRVLEAGDRDAQGVVLIHYGGYGATTEEAWEFIAHVRSEEIDRPVLLVAGGADKLRTPAAFEDRAARVRDCRTAVFDGAGHAPHIQFPDEFNALALEFLLP
jgi:pimeloyl-ACP methyl ester carboxylesterase